MPIIRIGRKQMSYWIGRKGLLGGRETLLFIHGAGGGQYTWSFQKSFFERRSNPVVIELPGHGESGGEGEEQIGGYAEHVHSFLKAMGIEKVFLVGHSMGGAIVQTLALTCSEMIKGVILVGTGARLRVLPVILKGIQENFEETVKQINQFAYSPRTPSDLTDKGVLGLMRCRPDVLYGDFLACDRFDIMNEVEKINLPTLIICGDEDQLTPVKYSQFLQSRIHGSKLEILTGAGHMVMMEFPQAFNEKIGEFILKAPSNKAV